MTPQFILSLLVLFLLGLVVGSFLNVCIHRWPRDQSVIRPRSHCPECETTLGWADLIPLISYLVLKARCRHCSARIPPRYPIVELSNGLLFAYLFYRDGPELMTAKMAIFGSMMIVLIFTDLTDYILPDEITLGGLIFGIVLSGFVYLGPGPVAFTLMIFNAEYAPWAVSLMESVVATLLLGGVLLLVAEAYLRYRKVEGLGLGDVKMIAMMAAFWGAGDTLTMVVLGSTIAAISGVLIVLISRKGWDYALPFGSYLGATAIIIMLWGSELMTWYMTIVTGG